MTDSIGNELTALESRLQVVEQQTTVARTPATSVTVGAGGAPVITDPLRWDTGWSNHSELVSGQTNPAQPNYPSLSWVHHDNRFPTPYAGAQATRVGPMCFLTGMALRTGATLAANTDHSVRMCRLPAGWRPRMRVPFGCVMAGGYPAMARLEVWPDTNVDAGGIYFVYASVPLLASYWIVLQGAFPCVDASLPGS
jgi:hypothetical protein